jgi:hypothetical protein
VSILLFYLTSVCVIPRKSSRAFEGDSLNARIFNEAKITRQCIPLFRSELPSQTEQLLLGCLGSLVIAAGLGKLPSACPVEASVIRPSQPPQRAAAFLLLIIVQAVFVFPTE